MRAPWPAHVRVHAHTCATTATTQHHIHHCCYRSYVKRQRQHPTTTTKGIVSKQNKQLHKIMTACQTKKQTIPRPNNKPTLGRAQIVAHASSGQGTIQNIEHKYLSYVLNSDLITK